jgi:hypothetical protein
MKNRKKSSWKIFLSSTQFIEKILENYRLLASFFFTTWLIKS